VSVNNHPTDIPSVLMKPGDTVKVKGREKSLKLARELMREGAKERIPDFLEVVPGEVPEGRLTRLPTRHDVDPRISDIREQLIIEIATR
jgi:small subunit ribosomal protein S4